MATETVQIALDRNWKLISGAVGGALLARTLSQFDAQFYVGSSAPSSTEVNRRATSVFRVASQADKVWARCARALSDTLQVTRVVDAGNPALPNPQPVTLSNTTIPAGAEPLSALGQFVGLVEGDEVTGISPNDGRVLLSPDRTGLLVGRSSRADGTFDLTVRIRNTLAEPNRRSVTLTISLGAGGGGVTPPLTAAIYGLVTKTADGSVGQTYTGPAWSGIQWYRETLAKPKTRTAIAGATSRNYVATADDLNTRLVMGGTDAGVAKFATTWAIVLPAPIVIESFDSTANFLTTTAGNPALSIDTTEKVQGTGSLIAASQGVGNRLMKSIGPLTAIPGVGNLAGLGTLAWLAEELDPYSGKSNENTLRLDQTGSTPASGGSMTGANNANVHKGKFWNSVRPDQLAFLQAKDPAQAWKFSYDRSSSTAAPQAQKVRLDAMVAKADCRSKLLLRFDDGYRIDEVIAELVKRNMRATAYIPSQKIITATSSSIMRWSHVIEAQAAGIEIQADGTPTDGSMVLGAANPAEAVALLKQCRSEIMANVPGADPRHFCYPNGHTDIYLANSPNPAPDHRTYADAATGSSGSASITGMVTSKMTGMANGMKVGGFGVQPGTTVQAFDSSAGTMTLSLPLTAALSSIAVWDDSHPFFLDKLQDAIRADGTFYTGSTVTVDSFHSRFGFAGRALLRPAGSMANGGVGNATPEQLAANAIARMDAAIARKESLEFYLHQVQEGATFIHTPLSTFITFLDAVVARQDAGLIDVVTASELWAVDGGASFPA
ncbi:polysaccharide deacetylase family protein [Aureimonas phyllosphaerae]|uniref:polysaccharide deacetylase family protein n=1 Tax=Aureimonas phyllosphaerae TaxID=1166078 RepID=UPI003A5BC412